MFSSYRSQLMDLHDKRDLIEVSQLIDLTDKPIGLTRDEIGWSRVRSNASNCICCCSNNSIALVTTENSYILDHVPLDNIQFAQTNASLQYLALSNHRKLAIIDLVDNDIKCSCQNSNNNHLSGETKVVNLSAHGLTMGDIVFWRWLDDSTIAILSYDALYTCSVNQQHINHPAYTAFSQRSRNLSMEKVFDTHPHISALCQVTDIQRDTSSNIYTISSLYSTSNLLKLNSATGATAPPTNSHQAPPAATQQQQQQQTNGLNSQISTSNLRPSFGSVPCRLSQLAGNDQQSCDNLKADQLFDPYRSHSQASEDIVCGLVQVYCKKRDLSQLIQAHATTFTNPLANENRSRAGRRRSSGQILDSTFMAQQKGPTILVAANKIGNQMRVHFTEMATFDGPMSSSSSSSTGQNASSTASFDHLTAMDFPTSIVCSHVNSNTGNSSSLHVALITTKHGQLFVCSVAHSTILFKTTIINDLISSTILESTTRGLMVICRNGQVLLVTLNLPKLMKLLDESKTLRHISSSHNILYNNNHNDRLVERKKSVGNNTSTKQTRSTAVNNQMSTSLDMGLEVLMSTKL